MRTHTYHRRGVDPSAEIRQHWAGAAQPAPRRFRKYLPEVLRVLVVGCVTYLLGAAEIVIAARTHILRLHDKEAARHQPHDVSIQGLVAGLYAPIQVLRNH